MNWKKTSLLLLCGSLTAATFLVAAWWASGALLDGWLFALYMPALTITILLSGGPHNINPVIGFAAQVVQTFLMIYLIAFVIVAAWYFVPPNPSNPSKH